LRNERPGTAAQPSGISIIKPYMCQLRTLVFKEADSKQSGKVL
jgi:hypothetical protein